MKRKLIKSICIKKMMDKDGCFSLLIEQNFNIIFQISLCLLLQCLFALRKLFCKLNIMERIISCQRERWSAK